MSFANRASLTFFLSSFYFFIFLSCPLALVGALSTVEQDGESGQPCLIPSWMGEEAFSLSLLRIWLPLGFLKMIYIKLRKLSLYFNFLSVLIMNAC